MSAPKEATPEERFKLWYTDIFDHLEHSTQIPDGNGALVALTAALPLYERWFQEEIRRDPTKNQPKTIGDDLGLTIENAKIFWNVFRDGLTHTGSFFEASSKSRDRNWTLPKVGLHSDYPNLPIFQYDAAIGKSVILVNPWGFVRHILAKYNGRPDLIRMIDAPLLSLRHFA